MAPKETSVAFIARGGSQVLVDVSDLLLYLERETQWEDYSAEEVEVYRRLIRILEEGKADVLARAIRHV